MTTKLLINARGEGAPVNGWLTLSMPQRELLNAELEIDSSKIEAFVNQYDAKKPLIINIEHWKLPLDIDNYIKVIDAVHKFNPGLRTGYYSIVPLRAWWQTFDGRLNQWKQINSELSRTRDENGRFNSRGLADVVDFVCPSLYTFYPLDRVFRGRTHETIWHESYAVENIKAAKQYQKKVYPVIWPRLHTDRKTQIDIGSFRRQIDTCLELADGVVIWDWIAWPGFDNNQEVTESVTELMKEYV